MTTVTVTLKEVRAEDQDGGDFGVPFLKEDAVRRMEDYINEGFIEANMSEDEPIDLEIEIEQEEED